MRTTAVISIVSLASVSASTYCPDLTDSLGNCCTIYQSLDGLCIGLPVPTTTTCTTSISSPTIATTTQCATTALPTRIVEYMIVPTQAIATTTQCATTALPTSIMGLMIVPTQATANAGTVTVSSATSYNSYGSVAVKQAALTSSAGVTLMVGVLSLSVAVFALL